MDVRAFTAAAPPTLHTGLRSSDGFVVRRCQMVLASARGQQARLIAEVLGCDDQPVRNAIQAFNVRGVAAVQRRSSAPHRRPHAVFTPARRAQFQAVLHQSPRAFGHPTSVWTLDLAAAVAYATGLLPRRGSGEAIRQALAPRKIRWKRAQHWITRPDPA